MSVEFTKEWINLIHKTINSNGCWISSYKSSSNGYVRISNKSRYLLLHRVVMCVYYNIDYDNKKIEARHDSRCDKACFNYEHLKPGTSSDNIKDSVKDKTHGQTRKSCCPKCGGEYKTHIVKTGWSRGEIYRICPACKAEKNRERYH